MSKLAKMLEAHDTGDRKFLSDNKFKMVEATTFTEPMLYGIVYGIGLKMGAKVAIQDFPSKHKNDDAIADAMRDVRKALVEEVFGEFRSSMREIVMACHERDYDKVRDRVTALEYQMFHEGING